MTIIAVMEKHTIKKNVIDEKKTFKYYVHVLDLSRVKIKYFETIN